MKTAKLQDSPNSQELNSEFERVRRDYFPRWDRRRQWRLIVKEIINELEGTQGQACNESKTIEIRRDLSGVALTVALIHEIAHAVVDGAHTKKWDARMTRAADRARQLGEKSVAESLDKQIEAYRQTPPLTAKMVYSEIADVVIENNGPPFDAVVDHICSQYGMPRKAFMSRYKRALTEYNKALEELKGLSGE